MKTVDFSGLEKKIAKIKDSFKRHSKKILSEATLKGAESASKFVPPKNGNSWSRSIPAKLYKRPVFPLSIMIKKDKRNKALYKEKLDQGFRFVVSKTSGKKRSKFFAKTLRQAKSRYSRIKYRGLLKVMYGINLIQVGKQSALFSKLLSKSPDLARVRHLNTIIYSNPKKDAYSMTNSNKAWEINSFARKSIQQASKVIKRTLNKLVKDWRKTIR